MYRILLFILFVSCNNSTKFCYQCKHFKRQPDLLFFDNRFAVCSMFPKADDNIYYLVTGKIQNVNEYYFCSTARNTDFMCDVIGKNFEKK